MLLTPDYPIKFDTTKMDNNHSIEISTINEVLVVDSRLLAQELGVTHKAFMETIRKYEKQAEQSFGILRFETAEIKGRGQPEKFAYLTEDQATFLMTLSRNTSQVIQCKLNLVKSFSKAKKVIVSQADRIRELELIRDIKQLETGRLEISSAMVTMHGKELALALLGKDDALVTKEVKTTEVVNPETERIDNILSAQQLKEYVYNKTGIKIKSMAQITKRLKALGRDDLLVAVTRNRTAEYIAPDRADEAISLVVANQSTRQLLLGENSF